MTTAVQTAQEVYCLACKVRVRAVNAEIFTLANNRKQLKGVCPDCGRKVSQFVKG